MGEGNPFRRDFDPDEEIVDEGRERDTAGTDETLQAVEVGGVVVVDSESEPEPVQSSPEDGESESLKAQYRRMADLALQRVAAEEYSDKWKKLKKQTEGLESEADFLGKERQRIISEYGIKEADLDENRSKLLENLVKELVYLKIGLYAGNEAWIEKFDNSLYHAYLEASGEIPSIPYDFTRFYQDMLGGELYGQLMKYYKARWEKKDRFDKLKKEQELKNKLDTADEIVDRWIERVKEVFEKLSPGSRRSSSSELQTASAGASQTGPSDAEGDQTEAETQQAEAESAEEEAQRAGCIAKAISGLIGTGKHLSKFVKNPRIQKALAVSSGVILASLFGAPLAAGATGGAIVCGGMKLGVGIYKGFKERKLKALVGNLAKGAGSGLKDFLLSPFNAPKKKPYEFKKISQQRLIFKEQSRFKHFVNKWVLEGIAGRGLGIGLGLTVAMVNELPVNSAVRIFGQIFGLQVTESAISAYAAGFIPRQFLLLADMLEKRDEKILRARFERIGRNYDQEKEKYYHSGQTLRRVANVMAKTASFIAAAAEITNLDERILDNNPTLARSINVTRGKASIRKLFGTSGTEEVIATQTEEPVTPEPTPQPEGTPEPGIEGSAKQSPTGIDQPELEVEETAPEITNGGSISDRTGLEPQASVGDVEELELKEIMNPKFTVKRGGTFWNSMKFNIPKGQNWEDKALTMVNDVPVNKEEVMRGVVTNFYDALGKQIRVVPAGKVFDIGADLTEKQQGVLQRMLEEVMRCDDPDKYWNELRPRFKVEWAQIAAEAMKPKGVY